MPVLQLRKLRLVEVKQLAQGHKLLSGWQRTKTLVSLNLDPLLLTSILYTAY